MGNCGLTLIPIWDSHAMEKGGAIGVAVLNELKPSIRVINSQ